MGLIWKAIKWMYGDSLKYIGFLLAVAAAGSAAILFFSYPLQVICSVVAIIVVYGLFCFFHEL